MMHRARRSFLHAPPAKRMLPTVIIAGAQRCGTTSLHHYLVQHPEIGAPRRKEIHYFDNNAHQPLDWYRGFFPPKGRFRHSIDSSPFYLLHPAAPARVRAVIPNVKIIVLVRDPIERSLSQYHHSRARGHETLSFEEAIAREPERLEGQFEHVLSSPGARSLALRVHSYVTRGLYAPQMARWYEHFPHEQILVLRSEDMFSDPAAVLARVHRWIGVPPQALPSLAPMNGRSYNAMEPALARQLADRFMPDLDPLERMTGLQFDWPWVRSPSRRSDPLAQGPSAVSRETSPARTAFLNDGPANASRPEQ